jgi:Leucine-rich repeat (LRR) protein
LNLRWLDCSDNQLSSIRYMRRIRLLSCINNQIVSLPNKMKHLRFLECSKNRLYRLPDELPKVKHLNCSHNRLRTIPKYPKMRTCDCFGNCIRRESAAKITGRTNVHVDIVGYPWW